MGSLFIRISDVISANINYMIDRVEDPERMIRQVILEMEDHIQRAEDSVIDAIASEKQLARELAHHRDKSEFWREKAEVALVADNEALAREALICKKEHDRTAKDLESAWKIAADTSKKLKSQLRDLKNKLTEARQKRSALVARLRAAQATQHMHKTQHHLQKGLNARDKFIRMEDKVTEIEARTEAIAELYDESSDLERQIDQLEIKTEVDKELEELRKKIGIKKC
ncbi:PspA/IM30 family protein [Desulfonema magnum]|uniref:Phage shock protein A n=1 Tax=Desulfonema magnum TaxID=45655 RepID=A0A975GT85_9BACT|nr:PspA/IM30 family protein [Desulfonema magnum]QTA92727.1 Phage shock protein A [Desulfonema magnum]